MEYISAVHITPTEVLAGDSVEFTITLTMGSNFTVHGSRLVFDLPGNLGYSRGTCSHQEANGYIEVFCSNPDLAYAKHMYNIEAGNLLDESVARPEIDAVRYFVLDFLGGEFAAGDEIIVKWGYVRHNFGIGAKVTPLVLEREYYNSIIIRYFCNSEAALPDYGRSFEGHERPIPDAEVQVRFRVLPREPQAIRIIRRIPTSSILVLDRFGNVCDPNQNQQLTSKIHYHSINDFGVLEIADQSIQMPRVKLATTVTPSMENVFTGKNIYFGDMHVHSSISKDVIERQRVEVTPAGQLHYGRQVSCLDFMAITDHHKPRMSPRSHIGADNWEQTRQAVSANHEDGKFVAFTGFEFQCERGDSTIILNTDLDYQAISQSGLMDIRTLWDAFKRYDYLSIPHFHNGGRLESGEWYECPQEGVEPVLEIYSCHGSFERSDTLERRPPARYDKHRREDRTGEWFLSHGFHYGFICNSDGHKGNPGRVGLTAVYAEELTRQAILTALRRRHVYGTTNARIRLLFTANGSLMGSILPNQPDKSLFISVIGEAKIKAVDIFRNGAIYRRFRPDSVEFATQLDLYEPERTNWYVRVIQVDNHIAYSSPIWFE